MTTVRVKRIGQNVQSVTVSGHAGFAMNGDDIVCAAISVLITTCANALESVAGVAPVVTRYEKDATMIVKIPNVSDVQQARDAQIVFKTILQGLEDVALAYPHNLEIL